MPERFLGEWPRDAFIPFSLGIDLPHCGILIMAQEHFCRRSGLSGKTVQVLTMYLRSTSSRVIFRFFETEGIAVMTTLVSRYKIEIKDEPEFADETFEERYARITDFDIGLTTL